MVAFLLPGDNNEFVRPSLSEVYIKRTPEARERGTENGGYNLDSSACHSYSSSVASVSTMPRPPEPTLRLVRRRLSVGNMIQQAAIKESGTNEPTSKAGYCLLVFECKAHEDT